VIIINYQLVVTCRLWEHCACACRRDIFVAFRHVFLLFVWS